MPGVWTYPWTLLHEGLDEAFERLKAIGLDEINCAGHYHSVRSMQPRFPSRLFEVYSGGAYFAPRADRYDEISPIQNRVGGSDDPFGKIVAAAERHDFDVNAWTVYHHNSQLGKQYPEFRTEDVFGFVHDHSFCPSNDAVIRYFGAIAEEIAAYQPREIQLESIGFPSVFHGHSMEFGHDKRQILTSTTEEWLLSQCFCDGCCERSRELGYEIEAAQPIIQEILLASFDDPHSDPSPLAALIREHEALNDLFRYREAVIAELLETLASRSGMTPLNAYLMDGFGGSPGDGWPAGVTLGVLEKYADRLTVMCYVSDPAEAEETIQTITRSIDLPVDVGLTLDPACIESRSQLKTMVETVRSRTEGRIFVYHHSLMTDAQLDWLGEAFAA